MKRLNTKKQIEFKDDLNKILKGTGMSRKSRTTVNFHKVKVQALGDG